MKSTGQKTEAITKTTILTTDTLQKKAAATEKSAQKAWLDYEKKSAAYEDAWKQKLDKITLLGLLSAAKIAKFTYKIKRTEHKLAKANWKASSKADKKSVEKTTKVKKGDAEAQAQ